MDNPVAFVMPTIPPQPVFRGDFQPHELCIYGVETDYYQECYKSEFDPENNLARFTREGDDYKMCKSILN